MMMMVMVVVVVVVVMVVIVVVVNICYSSFYLLYVELLRHWFTVWLM
jgi:hypothetical protein